MFGNRRRLNMDNSNFHTVNIKTSTNGRCGLKSKFHYILLTLLLCKILFVKTRFYTEPLSLVSNTIPSNQNVEYKSLQAQPFNVSTTPLFYHISPGTTGSRTLYHAACTAGYPSVHHKSFCISSSRGIFGVDEMVVRGVRAHYEVLRLHEMAIGCLKAQWRNDDTSRMTNMCSISLDAWATSLQTHLTEVLQSDLVGLFDTPYPYIAPQVLNLTTTCRSKTVIGLTERDPSSWAKSRIKHGLLLCRNEYSDRLESSEFDILGCISRAYEINLHRDLHFEDVFWYRSHHEVADPLFLEGMEHQMDRHQKKYVSLAKYTPNFFGASKPSTPIDEKVVAKDFGRILSTNLKSDQKNQALKCRGRVNWEMANDTFIELYHLPKTCVSLDDREENEVEMIPLIQLGENIFNTSS